MMGAAMAEQREFDVVLEAQPEGGYTVYVPDLPGCVSEGETVDEALEMIRDAISGYLASREERGWPLPHVEHRKVALA
jgi:predicted RNase H-like HicB family nuclease